jgi:hypothetical protein
MGDFEEDLEAKVKRLNLMSGGKPLPDVPAQSAKESDPIKAAKAKEQGRLNLNKNLFIERNVHELTQSVDDASCSFAKTFSNSASDIPEMSSWIVRLLASNGS